MSRDQRVVKFRRRKSINIGVVVFSILFLYIAINVYIYFTKDHMSIYEVKEGTTAEDNLITGLILRDESVVYSEKAGYVSYLQKEGSRAAKNASVFSIDENRQILDVLTSGENPITLSKQSQAEIKYQIQDFKTSFSNDNFSAVYEFKEDAQSTALDLLNQTMIDKGLDVQNETGLTYSYDTYQTQASGIISYYLDSYETVTSENVSKEMFDKEKYERTSLRTTEMISKNSPVYKMIQSELWSIVLPLTREQYEKLVGKEQVRFTILKDNYNTTAKLNLLQKGSEYYAELKLEKLMSNYLSDRFLDVKLNFDSAEGLKIPVSSLVEKEFYLVPIEYFTKGANSDSDGLTLESFDNTTGDVNYSFVPTDIYYQDDTYGYVDADQFSLGSWIRRADSDDRFQLTKMGKLTGVYNVNYGYAVFKRVQIIYQYEEYCIIEKNTKGGLSAYDHIALDGTTAVEQKIIY